MFKKTEILEAHAAGEIERMLEQLLPGDEALTITSEGERAFANSVPTGKFVLPYLSPPQALLVDELRRELIEAKERISSLEMQMKLLTRTAQGAGGALRAVITKQKSVLSQAQQAQAWRPAGLPNGGDENRQVEMDGNRRTGTEEMRRTERDRMRQTGVNGG